MYIKMSSISEKINLSVSFSFSLHFKINGTELDKEKHYRDRTIKCFTPNYHYCLAITSLVYLGETLNSGIS